MIWPDRTGGAITAALHSHAANLEGEAGKYQHNYQIIASAAGALTDAQGRLDQLESIPNASAADKAAGAQSIITALDGEYQTSHARIQDPVAYADRRDGRQGVGDDPSVSEWNDTTHANSTTTPTGSHNNVFGIGATDPAAPTGSTPPPSPHVDTPGERPPVGPPIAPGVVTDPDSGLRPEQPSSGGLAGAGGGGFVGAGTGSSGSVSGYSGREGYSGSAAATAAGGVGTSATGVPTTGSASMGTGRGQVPGVRTGGTGGRPAGAGGQPMPGVPGSGAGQRDQRREHRTDLVGDDDWLGLDDNSAAPWVIGGRRTAADLDDPAARLWESRENLFDPHAGEPEFDLGANAEYAAPEPFDDNWEVVEAEPEPPGDEDDRDWRAGLTEPELSAWSKTAGVELAPGPARD